MKLIPCPTCKSYAVGPPSAEFPDGAPVIVGRFTSKDALIVKCSKCRQVTKLDVKTFHLLPPMTPEEEKTLGKVG